MTDTNIADENSLKRYELLVNGQAIGFIEYYLFEHVVIVTHTEVNPKLEGRGNGSKLAKEALEYFAEQNKQVVPICGFFAQFIRKNQQFAHLVTPESRRIFQIYKTLACD